MLSSLSPWANVQVAPFLHYPVRGLKCLQSYALNIIIVIITFIIGDHRINTLYRLKCRHSIGDWVLVLIITIFYHSEFLIPVVHERIGILDLRHKFHLKLRKWWVYSYKNVYIIKSYILNWDIGLAERTFLWFFYLNN